ncbi:hypothetical protein JZ751_008341 [Albula glossodonta]|uniref:BMP-2-inducible protein kinase C-terminal domain-containing protein n=1 Tax=Albula glossodonta TaxID=121402 RepID=A0A8T2MN44_9TELE|nr:hypothetical protein JZ751_008341 [Albula glossodonta]
MHQYQQAFAHQQQQQQPPQQQQHLNHQQVPYLTSPLEFQPPLGTFAPAGTAHVGPASVEPPFTNTSRNPLVNMEVITPPPPAVSNPPDMSGWNPFGEDNFSKLTEEELLDREFDLLRASKCPASFTAALLVPGPGVLEKPVERAVSADASVERQQLSLKPLHEDLFGSVPFLSNPGKPALPTDSPLLSPTPPYHVCRPLHLASRRHGNADRNQDTTTCKSHLQCAAAAGESGHRLANLEPGTRRAPPPDAASMFLIQSKPNEAKRPHGGGSVTSPDQLSEEPPTTPVNPILEALPQTAKEHKPCKRSGSAGPPTRKAGEESDSDFESDPPSPKSSEEDEPEEDEGLNSEHGEFNDDTEPENLGQRPLLMDSEEEAEEEEDKHSSDSDYDQKKAKTRTSRPTGSKPMTTVTGATRAEPDPTLITPPASPGAAAREPPSREVDVFGAVPFLGGGQPAKTVTEGADVFTKAPFRQASQEQNMDEFDVFTKAPFNRNLSKTSKSSDTPMGQTPPVSPDSVDIFGCSPFQPSYPVPLSKSREDIFGQVPFDEASSPQQQKNKQRSLQKLSSRQRRTKQETVGGNGKRHHGTPTGGRKTNKPSFRTPERARRHKKVGRRDSQSSNEFLNPSDSKENISVTRGDVKDKGASLPSEEAMLDPFGAKPFHPQDGGRHPQHQGLGDGKGELNPANGRPRTSSLHNTFGDGNKMDDFGAVPFTELVVRSGTQQQPPQVELDPFGAAPFPSKQ